MDSPLPPTSPTQPEDERRLADLATFASGIVHDLRNPLNVIRTNLYLLRQRLPGEDQRITRAVDRIDDQVTVALRMLEAVQAFYKADHPAPQQVQLNDAVRSVLDTTPVPEGIEASFEPGPELPLVSVDPTLLDVAIRALFRNALDAVASGGTIQLGTRREDDTVVLEIRDSGPGLQGEAAERAFEPFFSTQRGRSGMGLTTVRKVAEAHGGEARLAAAPAGGVMATLQLPLSSRSA